MRVIVRVKNNIRHKKSIPSVSILMTDSKKSQASTMCAVKTSKCFFLWCNGVLPYHEADTTVTSTFTTILDPKGRKIDHLLKVFFFFFPLWFLISVIWPEHFRKGVKNQEWRRRDAQYFESNGRWGLWCSFMQKQWHLVDSFSHERRQCYQTLNIKQVRQWWKLMLSLSFS